MKLVTIEKALGELKKGSPVILTDHTENVKGCLVVSAAKCTPAVIEKFLKFGSQKIEITISKESYLNLDFSPAESFNGDKQISVNADFGTATGNTPAEINLTIKTFTHKNIQPNDFVSPGFVYPVDVLDGGCLVKPVFPESAADLSRLAGDENCAVFTHILNSSGDFANEYEITKIAGELGICICSIHDLVEYRFVHEPLVERINSVNLPTEYGDFRLHVYTASFDPSRGVDLALTFGRDTFLPDDVPLVRVHSEWSIANIVNRLSFEDGSFLNRAMKKVSESGQVGAIIFLRNTPEQHTNSLFAQQKKPTDIWFENGYLKTLSPMGSSMSYGFGAQILRDLGVKKMKILTHKENSFKGIDKYGLEILEQIPF